MGLFPNVVSQTSEVTHQKCIIPVQVTLGPLYVPRVRAWICSALHPGVTRAEQWPSVLPSHVPLLWHHVLVYFAIV